MFVSKFGETYDTASDASSERWDNDGGPIKGSAQSEPQAQPGWSVRSLRALNKAIQQTKNDEPRRQEEEERNRTQRQLDQLVSQRHAAQMRALRDWNRNPWENT